MLIPIISLLALSNLPQLSVAEQVYVPTLVTSTNSFPVTGLLFRVHMTGTVGVVWHLIRSECPGGGRQVSAPTVRTLSPGEPDTNPLEVVILDGTEMIPLMNCECII